MCKAVVGGSIHRAATSVSAASVQRSTTQRPSHRTYDRRGIEGGIGGNSSEVGSQGVWLALESHFRIIAWAGFLLMA